MGVEINNHAHAFPIDRDGQPRFIAVREKLYREETIVHQARTPFNSRLLDKEENEREQRLVKSVLPEIKSGEVLKMS